jgi:hypothetical protein
MSVSVFPTPTSSNLPLGATSTIFAGTSSLGDYTSPSTVTAGTYIAYISSPNISYTNSTTNLGVGNSTNLPIGTPTVVNFPLNETSFSIYTRWNQYSNSFGTTGNFSQNGMIWDGTNYYNKTSLVNIIAFSSTGAVWTTRSIVGTGSIATRYPQQFAYNNGVTNKYLALGTATTSSAQLAATSTDGVTWTSRTLARTGTQMSGAVINEAATNKYVVCDLGLASNFIQTSTDGVTWTSRTVSSGASPNGYSATNGTASTNQIYVYTISGTVGVTTSTDGVTWTSRTVVTNNNAVSGIAFGAGIYLTTESEGNGFYATSTDGVTWTSRTYPRDSAGLSYNGSIVSFTNGLFYTGNSGGYLESADGINWQLRSGDFTSGTWIGNGSSIIMYSTARSVYLPQPAYIALYSTTGSPVLN